MESPVQEVKSEAHQPVHEGKKQNKNQHFAQIFVAEKKWFEPSREQKIKTAGDDRAGNHAQKRAEGPDQTEKQTVKNKTGQNDDENDVENSHN